MSRAGWCALCLVAVACDGAPTPRQIVGCARVEADGEGDVCVVPSDDTRLLVRPGASVEAERTGHQAWITAAQATGTWRCGDDARTCRVAVRAADPVLEEATALRWRDPEAALARLQSLADDPDPKRRVRARALAARVRGASDPSGAVATLRETSREAERLGLWTDAMRDAVAAAHLSRSAAFRFDEARDALASVAPLAVRDPGMALELRYHTGLVARDVGDLRSALEAFETVVTVARARGDVRREREASSPLVRLYAGLDRRDEEDAIWTRLAALDGDDACAEADRLTNRAWIGLLAAERGAAFEGRAFLDRAEALYLDACADPTLLANVRLNAALADWHEGKIEDAARRLADVERGHATLDVWRVILQARLEPARAAVLLASVDARGSSLAWRVAVERGRALESADVAGALDAYAEAEAVLEQELEGVPLEVGREGFVGRRDESVRRLIRLAWREGQTTRALAAARVALSRDARGMRARDRIATLEGARRARFEAAIGEVRRARAEVASLAERGWSLALEERPAHEARIRALEARASSALDAAHAAIGDAGVAPSEASAPCSLPPLVDGEVVVALLRDGERTLVLVGDEGRAHVAEAASLDAVGEALRGAESSLREARRVRVVADAASRALDVGAIRLANGRALLETVPVVDAMDVSTPSRPTARRALVVADPRGDLAASRREGREVAEALRAKGYEVQVLEGEAATYAALSEALPHVSLLHYAGHHVAGERLRGALPLAGDATFDVRDVLASPSVPERVVLSGCATAGEGDLSMARAFVLAGARSVVGTSRDVDDEGAARFLRAWRERGLDEDGFFATRTASWERGDVEASAFRWIVP